MVWFIGTVELKYRGYDGFVWMLVWGIPVAIFFGAMELSQPLRKIIREKPLSYPETDPNPRDCGSCGITLNPSSAVRGGRFRIHAGPWAANSIFLHYIC